MTTGTPRLLLAAAGEPWEAHVLTLLAAPGTPAALARRCVDVPDVVAAAAAGQGTAAVVSVALAGLDPDVVARLRDTGIGVVAVASGATAAARARGLGLDPVLDAGAVSADPAVVLAAVARLAEAGGHAPDEGLLPPAATEHPPDGADSGRVVAVWGPTGAPGRSTVGLGLAAAAADAGDPDAARRRRRLRRRHRADARRARRGLGRAGRGAGGLHRLRSTTWRWPRRRGR